MIVSINWRIPATILCQCFINKCCRKYEFYRRKGYQKSNAIRITAIMPSTLWWPLYSLFSYCFTLYRLRWCLDAVIIFLLYLSIHISTVKYPKQNKWFNKWRNQLSMLSSTKTLLYNALDCALGIQCSFLQLFSKAIHWFACKTNRTVTGVLQLIETIMHAWSVTTSSQSTQFKPKMFSYHIVVLE